MIRACDRHVDFHIYVYNGSHTHIDVTLAGRFWFVWSQSIHGYLYRGGKHGSPINLCKAGRLLVTKSCIARTTIKLYAQWRSYGRVEFSLRSGKWFGLGRRTIRRGGGGVHGVVKQLQDLNCSQARIVIRGGWIMNLNYKLVYIRTQWPICRTVDLKSCVGPDPTVDVDSFLKDLPIDGDIEHSLSRGVNIWTELNKP